MISPGINPSKAVNEPFTELQIQAAVRILQDLSAFDNVWSWSRPESPTDKDASLWEHNEMIRFGASPTACPSGRVPWDEIIDRLAEEDMDAALKDELRERRVRLLLDHNMLNFYTLRETDTHIEFIANSVVIAAIPILGKPDYYDFLPAIE